MKQILVFLTLGIILNSCGSERTDCEKNQTGEVQFNNISKTDKTYDIVWDGVDIATIGPNEKSKLFTYAANVPHTLVFRITNTSENACNESTPILNQCQENIFSCDQ